MRLTFGDHGAHPRAPARWVTYLVFAIVMGACGVILAQRQARLRGEPVNFVVSDGRGYYAYLPAVVIEHTLDLSSQYRNHWAEDFYPELLTRKTERGYVIDKYPIGMALTLSPAFVGAHLVARQEFAKTADPRFTPDGYSPVYQYTIFAFVLSLGLATMLLIDAALVNDLGCSPAATLAGVLAFWGGSHYAWYYFREPLMVHAVSTFWVTAAIVLALRVMAQADAARISHSSLFALLFSFSMAIVCRPTNIFMTPVLLLAGHSLATSSDRAGRNLLWCAVTRSPWVLALFPILLQLWAWHHVSGHWLFYSYGGEGFHWKQPQLFSTLFSTRHGLFIWSPMLLLSLTGIVWRWPDLAGRRGFVAMLFASALVLWYFNSAWHSWWFGWAFGGRAFLELALLFAFGLACAFEQVRSARAGVRRAMVYAVALMVLYNYVLMNLYATRTIPPDGYWFKKSTCEVPFPSNPSPTRPSRPTAM